MQSVNSDTMDTRTKPLSLFSPTSKPLASPTFRTRSPTVQPSTSPTLGYISEYAYLASLASKSSPTSPHRSVNKIPDGRSRGQSEPPHSSRLFSPTSPPSIAVNGQTSMSTHNHIDATNTTDTGNTTNTDNTTDATDITTKSNNEKASHFLQPKMGKFFEERATVFHKVKNQVVYRRDLTETLDQDVTVVMFPRDETLTRLPCVTHHVEPTAADDTKEDVTLPTQSTEEAREGKKVKKKRSFLSKDGKKEAKKEKNKADNARKISGGGLSKWSMPDLSSKGTSPDLESPSPQGRAFFKKKKKIVQKTGWKFQNSATDASIPATTSELSLEVIGESSEAPPSYDVVTRTVSMECVYSPQNDVPLTVFKSFSTDDLSSEEENDNRPTLSPLMPDILKDRQDTSPLSMDSIVIEVPDIVPPSATPQPTVELHHTDAIVTDAMVTYGDTVTHINTTTMHTDTDVTHTDTTTTDRGTTVNHSDGAVNGTTSDSSSKMEVSTESSGSTLSKHIRKESTDSLDEEENLKDKKKFARFANSRKPVRKSSMGGKSSPLFISLTPQLTSRTSDSDEGSRPFSKSPSNISLNSLSPSPRSTPIFKPKGRSTFHSPSPTQQTSAVSKNGKKNVISTTSIDVKKASPTPTATPTKASATPTNVPANVKKSVVTRGSPSSPKTTPTSSPALSRKSPGSFRKPVGRSSPKTTPTSSPALSRKSPGSFRKSVGGSSPKTTPTSSPALSRKSPGSFRKPVGKSSPKTTPTSSPILNRKSPGSFHKSVGRSSPLTPPTNSPRLNETRKTTDSSRKTSGGSTQARKSVGKGPSSPLTTPTSTNKRKTSADSKPPSKSLAQSLSTENVAARHRKKGITSVSSPLAEDKFDFDKALESRLNGNITHPKEDAPPSKETRSEMNLNIDEIVNSGGKASTYVYRSKKAGADRRESVPTKDTTTYKYTSSVENRIKKSSLGGRESVSRDRPGSGRYKKKKLETSPSPENSKPATVLSSPVRSRLGRSASAETRVPVPADNKPSTNVQADETMSILSPLDTLMSFINESSFSSLGSQPARPFSPTSPPLSQEDNYQAQPQTGDEDSQLTYIYRSTLLKKGTQDSPSKPPLSRTSSNKSLTSPQHEAKSHTLQRTTSPRKASLQTGTLTRQSRRSSLSPLHKTSTLERGSMKRKSIGAQKMIKSKPATPTATPTDNNSRRASAEDVKPKTNGLPSSHSVPRTGAKSNMENKKPVSKNIEKVKSSKPDSPWSTESDSTSPSTPSPHPPKDMADGGVASKQSLPKGKPPSGKLKSQPALTMGSSFKSDKKVSATDVNDLRKSRRSGTLKLTKQKVMVSPERPGSMRLPSKKSVDSIASQPRGSIRASRRTSAGTVRKLSQSSPGSTHTLSNKKSTSSLTSSQQASSNKQTTPDDTFGDFDHISSLAKNRMASSVADHKRAVRPLSRQKPSSSHLQILNKRDNVSSEITTPTTTSSNFDPNSYSTYMGKKVLHESAVVGLAAKLDFTTVKLRKTGVVEQMMSEQGGSGKASSRSSYDPSNSYGVPVTSHPVMLLSIKGRKQIQTRLVEPVASSINSGDVFILISGKDLFLWQGKESNVIEKARGTDLVNRICQRKELGCQATMFTKLEDSNSNLSKKEELFWNILQGKPSNKLGTSSVPSDESYEKGMNMATKIYQFMQEGESVRYVLIQENLSVMPKISILDSKKILLFDFYGEVYVWIGKSSTQSLRKPAVVRARKMFDNGCVPPSYPVPNSPSRKVSVTPGATTRASGRFRSKSRQVALNASTRRKSSKGGTLERKSSKSDLKARPSWALFARINEGSEMLLFREKFSDWPEPGRIIKMKGHESSGEVLKAPVMPELQPADVKTMLKALPPFEGLRLEGENVHRGRGNYKVNRSSFACNRVRGISAVKWHIKEFDNIKVPEVDNCIFYNGESYVIRWAYTITVVRELEGLTPGQGLFARDRQHVKELQAKRKHPLEEEKVERTKKESIHVREEDVCSSDDGVEHSDEESKKILESGGRDRCAYFFWQGSTASINEKGAAAVMTVELDTEKSPQIRVPQGKEHPAFLQLFNGAMIVLCGKSENNDLKKCRNGYRLYYSGGSAKKEAYLIEIDVQQPVSYYCRSRGCLVMQHTASNTVYVWVGCQATFVQKSVALYAAKYLKKRLGKEFQVVAAHEGCETDAVANLFDIGDRKQYSSLLNVSGPVCYTPRMFHLRSATGWFTATEELQVSRPSSANTPNAFPFLQEELYTADQPALFIIDGWDTVYLWIGWWPQQRNKLLQEKNALSGSALSRWARDKKLALQTVLNYAEECKRSPPPQTYVVTAGREHQDFTNLFPSWNINPDVQEIVRKNGVSGPCKTEASAEFTKYTRTSYTLAELQKRPEEVDLKRLETYLSDAEFESTFKMSKDEFAALLPWRQIKIKKEVGLF